MAAIVGSSRFSEFSESLTVMLSNSLQLSSSFELSNSRTVELFGDIFCSSISSDLLVRHEKNFKILLLLWVLPIMRLSRFMNNVKVHPYHGNIIKKSTILTNQLYLAVADYGSDQIHRQYSISLSNSIISINPCELIIHYLFQTHIVYQL